MNDFVLYPQDTERINSILRTYISEAGLECALVTTKDGQLLTYEGQTESIDTMSVAALITGSFAATVTIANLIGESEFRTMSHRGKDRHFHICLIDPDRYLASVFGNGTTVERVSQQATHFAKELCNLFLLLSGNADSAVLPEFFGEGEDNQESATPDSQDVFNSLESLEALEEQAEQEADLSPPPGEDTQQRPAPSVQPPAAEQAPPSPELQFIRKKIQEAASYRSRLME